VVTWCHAGVGEFYWGKFAGRWARGSDYGATAVEWSRAITAALPDVRTLGVACHSFEYGLAKPSYRGRAWNAELYPVLAVSSQTRDRPAPPAQRTTALAPLN
jgi:hypothetical protein